MGAFDLNRCTVITDIFAFRCVFFLFTYSYNHFVFISSFSITSCLLFEWLNIFISYAFYYIVIHSFSINVCIAFSSYLEIKIYTLDLSKWSEVTQSCPILCDPMDSSLPGSSVHGIFQARILEWVAISFSRGSSQPRDWTQVSHIAGRHFTIWAKCNFRFSLFPERFKCPNTL